MHNINSSFQQLIKKFIQVLVAQESEV